MHVIYVHQHSPVVIVINVNVDGMEINAMYVIRDIQDLIAIFVPLAGYQRRICLVPYAEHVNPDIGEDIVRHVDNAKLTIHWQYVGITSGMKLIYTMLIYAP